MSKQLKANHLHALFVGIICGVLIGVYAALPIETPLYWAAFIMIPTVFMFGGEWKDVPFHWVNAAIGLFLGGALTFVITQQLVPWSDGTGRSLCAEIMTSTKAGAASIRDSKERQLPSLIELGGEHGMVTMNASLASLVRQRRITLSDAMKYSNDPDSLERMI